MSPDLWNLLHDGELTAARRAGDALTLRVRIPYLCGELPTAADTLTLTLAGCDLLAWTAYGEPPTADPAAAVGATIMGATAHPDRLGVDGLAGELDVRYTSAAVTTAEGRVLSPAELAAAADRYWAKWEASNRRDPD